jgi:cytochrome c biogenesis protein CcmG/thiol:disulfide interchange protein DsbE
MPRSTPILTRFEWSGAGIVCAKKTGLDTLRHSHNNYSRVLVVSLKKGASVEVDCHMPELAENATVQGSVRKNKPRRKILIFCGVSVLNVGLLALILTQLLTPAPNSGSDPLVGHPAPNFSMAMLRPESGKSALSLSNFKGKPVVLNFWASWCDPCKEEAPLLENTWKQMQEQGKDVVFLGIAYQDSSNNSLSFLQQNKITYPTLVDADGSVSTKYGLTSLPETIFISRNGTVMSKVPRQLTAQVLSSGLQMIL